MDEREKFVRETKVKDLLALAQEKGKRGFVAQANADGTAGLVSWQKASRTPDNRLRQDLPGEDASTEDRQIARLFDGLPPIRRRSAEERFRSMLNRVIEDAMVSYRVHGYPVWPKSIADKLRSLGWKENDPDVYGQCSALVKQLFIEAGHKQQAKDQKKATLDWHGHYNHQIEVKTPVTGGLAGPSQVTPAAS